MQEFLDAGFTTVLCAICPDQAIELRQRDRVGRGEGTAPVPREHHSARASAAVAAARARWRPRWRSGAVRHSRPPRRPTQAAGAIPAADTIKAVEAVAAKKYDYIKTVITTTPGGPETDTLKLIVSEGKKHNLPTITHAVTVIDTLAAVEARPAVLVHTPHIGRLEEDADGRQDDRECGHPDDVDAGRIHPALRRRQQAALPRRDAVSVGHDLECRPGTRQRAPALGSGHVVRLRHRHELAAEGSRSRTNCARSAWCSRRSTSARSSARARRERRSSRIRSARSNQASSRTWCSSTAIRSPMSTIC